MKMGGFVKFVDDLAVDFEGVAFVSLGEGDLADCEFEYGAWLFRLLLDGLFAGDFTGFFLFLVVAEVDFGFGCFSAAGRYEVGVFAGQ